METTFSSARRVEISADGPNAAESSIDVASLDGSITDVRVGVAIDHTFTADLVVVLVAPDRRQAVLARNVGADGDDIRATFADAASSEIAAGSPPFVGEFRPSEPLSGLAGADPNGQWRLVVVDEQWDDGGELLGWSLELTTEVGGNGGTGGTAGGHPIEVVVRDGLNATQIAAFDRAAERWASVLRSSAPRVRVGGDVIDGVRIEAAGVTIDGPAGILGQAGPIALRPDSMIPATGVMEFDTGDLAMLELQGNLVDVITHEMGHVLGIGTLWTPRLLVAGSGTVNPTFVGQTAAAEFATLVAPIAPPGSAGVPIENTGGAGTREGHWRESVFGNELMTGFVDADSNPLSRVTIASLFDVGYQVELDAADPFELPTPEQLALMDVGSDRTFQRCCTLGSVGRGPGMVPLPPDSVVD